jgi:hypothetical protein
MPGAVRVFVWRKSQKIKAAISESGEEVFGG